MTVLRALCQLKTLACAGHEHRKMTEGLLTVLNPYAEGTWIRLHPRIMSFPATGRSGTRAVMEARSNLARSHSRSTWRHKNLSPA